MAVKVGEFPKGILAEVTTTDDLNRALIALTEEYLSQQAETRRIQLASQKIQKEYQESIQVLNNIQTKITPLLGGSSKTILANGRVVTFHTNGTIVFLNAENIIGFPTQKFPPEPLSF